MIPAKVLSKALNLASRSTPTAIAALPGRVVVRGKGLWVQIESSSIAGRFCCRELPSLGTLIKGFRRSVEVDATQGGVVLRAAQRELEVASLGADPWDPLAAPAFSIRASRGALRQAVERFARRDSVCLLHYTHDALYLENEKESSRLSDHRRTGGPVRVVRAVSGQMLRRVALALRTDEVELRILGEWNGSGPVVWSEPIGEDRITMVIGGESFLRARHLTFRDHIQQQPKETIYSGATQRECEELFACEERGRAAEWVEIRRSELERLREMAKDEDRREETAELEEHLAWGATNHRATFPEGCGIGHCDACVVPVMD